MVRPPFPDFILDLLCPPDHCPLDAVADLQVMAAHVGHFFRWIIVMVDVATFNPLIDFQPFSTIFKLIAGDSFDCFLSFVLRKLSEKNTKKIR